MSVYEKMSEKEIDQLANYIVSIVQNGTTLKDESTIPEGFMEGIYSFAYDFYQKGKLDEAEAIFKFLCLYDFYNVDYIMGLAAVNQLKKQYQAAVDLYALAYLNADKDYRPVFYAGQCNLSLGEKEKAKYCFDQVVKNINDETIKEKAIVYLESLKDIPLIVIDESKDE
ncbi:MULTISPECIES: type III secretion system translocator chaperone SicA [Proteus]|nr:MULTISPECIES: type III secretion system translocator chaperone SicA [Proteus]NBL77641.1 type III secretion system translocator chaperone SicA [Proteus sp. G2672]NBL89653.1 type III secretion system translocator chaperone SicA [Proteus sp. G2673]NBM01963.1 type III secretion system translocator chaperone SicA [Proteus sp. G2671]NBM11596.1 type III secretion system translocator chaperone SicA [Proteus sp. G2670]NBM31298.1 type III secretion system translocator chaperone SicA [Proteus sp. G266